VPYAIEPFDPNARTVPAGYSGVVSLKDRGNAGADATLSGTATYSEASGLLSLGGAGYSSLPSTTLGSAGSNGFSVLLSIVSPSTLPSSAQTVFSYGNDVTGANGAALRVTLQGSQFALSYGLTGNSNMKTFTSSAVAVAGAASNVLVRCFPNMVFCMLGSF